MIIRGWNTEVIKSKLRNEIINAIHVFVGIERQRILRKAFTCKIGPKDCDLSGRKTFEFLL